MVSGRVVRWEPFLTGYGIVMVLKEKWEIKDQSLIYWTTSLEFMEYGLL